MPVFDTPTVAAWPLAVLGGGDDAAVAPPPPHPATTAASTASPPAPSTLIDLDLLRVMLAPYVRKNGSPSAKPGVSSMLLLSVPPVVGCARTLLPTSPDALPAP